MFGKYRKSLDIMVLLVLAFGALSCQSLKAMKEKNAAIRASSLKTDQEFSSAAQSFAKEVERCEAGGLQDCIYGLPFGPADEQGGKKLAKGICSATQLYFDTPENAPCRLMCANTELAHRKECIGAYGYTAVLYPGTAIEALPTGNSLGDSSRLGPGLRTFWSALNSSSEWTTSASDEARALASGGSLIALTVKEKEAEGIFEYIILFERHRVGFVRWQRLPKDIDGQFFLAKGEEKYGKAERLQANAPFSKLYRWKNLGKRHRLMAIARGIRESSDLGQARSNNLLLASNGKLPLFAGGTPDELITVMVDIEKMRDLVKSAISRQTSEKESENAEKAKQKQKEINDIQL